MSKKNKKIPVSGSAHPKNFKSPLITSPLLDSRLWTIVLPVFAFLLYAQTLSYDYALDDVAVITQNKFVQEGVSGIPKLLTTFYWEGFWSENAGLYRPASMIMFAIEYEFGDGSPKIHHFMNVLLYAFSILLLYRFLNLLLKNYSGWIPVLATLIFAVHPYHTEVVANIKSRDEILCFLFFTLSGIFLLQAADKNNLKNNLLSSFFLFLSLMSKEGGVLFLPILGLLLFQFRDKKIPSIAKSLVPHFAVTLLWLAIHWFVIAKSGERVVYDWRHNSLIDAPDFLTEKATAIGILGRYLIKLFYPYEFSYDYSFSQIPNKGFADVFSVFGMIASIALLFVAFRTFKKNPLLSFAILFFFITISLTSNIFKLIGATAADRFLYAPSLGFAIAIAVLLSKLNKKNIVSPTPLLLLLPLLAFYSFKTVKRNPDWETSDSLYLKDVQTAKNSSRTNFNAATVLMNNGLQLADTTRKREMLDSSRNYLLKAVELDPRDPNHWINLGVVNYKSKRYLESARATLEAIKRKSADSSLYANLGDAYYMAKMYDSSIYYHTLLVNNKLFFKETFNFLGSAYFNKQDYANAAKYFYEGVKRDSTYADLVVNYANALAMNKRYPEAIKHFKKAYSLNPSQINSVYFIALTYQNMGEVDSTKKYLDLFNRLKSGK